MKSRLIMALLWGMLCFVPRLYAHTTLYATADNGAGVNLFGTLNLETGEFTEIAQTTPLFYALTLGPEGRIYGSDVSTGSLFTISTGGVTKPYGSVTAPAEAYSGGYLGLASRGEDDLLAVNVDPIHVSLYRIGKHARTQTDLGIIEGPDTGVYFNGSLTFGPRDTLYFEFVPPSGSQLYTLDPFNGAPTPVGSGLGTDVLTLFSDGHRLFGIDTIATSKIRVYVIDTTSGAARYTGVTVKGLPSSGDFYLDAAVFVADERRCE